MATCNEAVNSSSIIANEEEKNPSQNKHWWLSMAWLHKDDDDNGAVSQVSSGQNKQG
jgi:hypothetical protein